MVLSAERWQALIPKLDEALALDASEREHWLATLAEQEPAVASEIADCLRSLDAADAQGFMAAPIAAVLLPSADAHVPAEGLAIGAYTLREPLGAGGMGSVWRAERSDGRYEGSVAIKLLHAGLLQPAMAQRFQREGSILAKLSHPHIAHLLDSGLTTSGQPYLVLEHVRGETIDAACDRRRLGIDARLALFLDVCDAVAHAHRNLVIHRDLKPANVLLTHDGQIKLLDFGIARLIEADDAPGREAGHGGEHALTPRWAAPEQRRDEPVTTATDVHGLGLLLQRLLSGQAPAGEAGGPLRKPSGVFDGSDTALLAQASEAARARATTPQRLARRLCGDLDTIVCKALAPEPTARYSSADALADDLRRHLADEPVLARDPGWRYLAGRFIARHRVACATAAAALVAVGLASGVAVEQAQQARAQRDLAVQRQLNAMAASQFVGELIGMTDAEGRVLRVEDVVDQGVLVAQSLFAERPDVLAELLMVLGRKNMPLQRGPEREQAAAAALEAARRAGDAPLVAHAECLLATMDMARRVERHEAVLRDMPADTSFALPRYRCHSSLSYFHAGAGRTEAAMEHAVASERELQHLGPLAAVLAHEVEETYADVHRSAGRYAEADHHFARQVAALTASGREHTLSTVMTLNSRGLMRLALGRPREAEAQWVEIKRLLAGMTRADSYPAYIETNHAIAMAEQGRLDEAVALLRHSVQRAEATGSKPYLASAQGQLGELLVRQGLLDEAEALIDRHAAYLESTSDGEARLGLPLLQRARLAEARGDRATARRLAAEAIEALARNPMLRATRTQALILAGEIEASAGQPALAEAHARAALDAVYGFVPTGTVSSHGGRAALLLARAQAALGSIGAAQTARAARAELLESLGPGHPDTLAAQALATRLDDRFGPAHAQAAR